MAVMSAAADALSTLNDVLESPGLKMMLAAGGGVLFVMNVVMIFLPKQPSPAEKAIAKALDTITKKMDVLHGEQMTAMS